MGSHWQRNLSWKLDLQDAQDKRKSSGHASNSFTDSQKKGSHGGWHSIYISVYNLINIIFISCAGWYTSKISESLEKHYFH